MSPKHSLSAVTLGQIALIQSMVAHLPDNENILRFVCRGLLEVPGIDRVDYCLYESEGSEKRAAGESRESMRKFIIKLKDHEHGELLAYVSDAASFAPYVPFIENLSHMLAVIFEERRQSSLNQAILADLEKRVYERTKELEIEIGERRQAEENLRITLNSIGDAVISTDIDGNITRMNPVAELLTGWSRQEALGKPLADVFFAVNDQTREPIANLVEKVLKAGKTVALTGYPVLIAKDGAEHQIGDAGSPIRDARGNIIGVVVVFRDVTEQLRTTQELLKIKKLESVGILAGGIAHDFNNLLTGIFGNLELAKMFLPADHKSYKFLDEAGRSMDSATNLTKQLLTFAKGGDPIKETLSIGEVITSTARFSVRGSKARLQTDIAPDLWLVEADKGQLSQVISNLVINAEQAMPLGGTITITAKNVKTSEGSYVQIAVKDEGVGIAAQYLDKIFDPYFTTKQKGSGLGLAITHSIISKHNGRIAVESQPHQGTTFTIHLPATTKTEESTNGKLPGAAGSKTVFSARVLVMDDEEMVRAVIGAMLAALGCEAAFATDGQQAIAMYRTAYENGAPYDVVITDLTIPGGIGGQAAAQEILKIDPQAKIIASSGYATDRVLANCEAYGFKGIAVKPFSFTDLQKVMQQVLAR